MRILWAVFLLFPTFLSAQSMRKVCGESTYYAESSESLDEAKLAALQAARVQALAEAFGTVVSQNTISQETLSDGSESAYFTQLNTNEVRGEWIENSGEPVYEVSLVDGMLVVKCSVCGMARELTNRAVEFQALVLRNGTDSRFAGTDFKNGDDLFLEFEAPIDGYVAVYLLDASRTAYCLLPYGQDADGQQEVKGGKKYVFFSPAHHLEKKVPVDEYVLTCNGNMEVNQLYVVFSPNPFVKPLDGQARMGLPRQLGFEDFSKWLGRSRKRDPEMGLQVMNLKVGQ